MSLDTLFTFNYVINSLNFAYEYCTVCSTFFLFLFKILKIYSAPMYGHRPSPVSGFSPPGHATGIPARKTAGPDRDSRSDPTRYCQISCGGKFQFIGFEGPAQEYFCLGLARARSKKLARSDINF